MRLTARIATAFIALAAAGCGGMIPRESQPMPPELKLDGVRFRIYRSDTLKAFGVAATASLRRDSSELHAQQLDATLPRDPVPVRITAPSGSGSLATRRFEATGGVVVSRGDDAARTERARYQPEGGHGEGLVLGDDPVTVTGRAYRLTGKGFTLDPAEGTIVVRGGASIVAGLRGPR